MRMRKVSSMVLVIALMVVCSMGTCFAGTLPENSVNSVPVCLTVENLLTIDFTISEKIDLTGDGLTDDLTVSDLVIANNSTMGQIELTSLEASAVDGWTLESADTDFVNMAADSKKIAVMYGEHDFAEGIRNFADDEFLIDASTSESIALDAKTGPVTKRVFNYQVARVIATIAIN